MPNTLAEVTAAVGQVASQWRSERAARQVRRSLDRDDFAQLRGTGLLSAIAPSETGGLWQGAGSSARPLCEIYRRLASADSSVALVSSMHPAVIAFWLASSDASQPAWE